MCSGRGRERGSALVSCTYYEMITSYLPLLKFLQNLENIFPVSSDKTRPAPDKLSSKQFVKDHTHTKKLKTKIIELGIWSRNMCHLWRHPVSGTLQYNQCPGVRFCVLFLQKQLSTKCSESLQSRNWVLLM